MPFRSISHQHYSISTALNDINNSTNSTSPYDVLLQIHPIGLGVIFTTINWLFTTLGAAACFFMICCAKSTNRFYDDFLALSFGLGGGIMLAASFFSLLVPAIELSEKQYPEYVSVLPVFGGFAIGIIFFLVFDVALDYINDYVEKKKIQYDRELQKLKENELSTIQPMLSHHEATPSSTSLLQASDSCENIIRPSKEEDKTDQSCVELPVVTNSMEQAQPSSQQKQEDPSPTMNLEPQKKDWKRRMSEFLIKFRRSSLLMMSMTIHNLPEGVVVGVAFGSIGLGKTGISISSAVSLSIGVGIQNIPEGLSVSLPLVRDGAGFVKAFLIGSASALVEIIGGLIGSGLVYFSESILPYALSFAAACMVFVVVNELIPETITKHGHGCEPKSDLVPSKLEEGKGSSLSLEPISIVEPIRKKRPRFYKLTSRIGLTGFFLGFIVMMILDLVL